MGQDIIETPLPIHAQEILDIAAISSSRAEWMIVDRDGLLLRFDAEAGSATNVGRIPPHREPDHTPFLGHELRARIHVSARGDFVAIANDYGTLGSVYDTGRGRVTLDLHGGGYHAATVPFSFCFVEHHGRALAIHRTEWNRLDISDAASGTLLSQREPTAWHAGGPRPQHYLDYFHGRLLLSPGGSRIVDDGWVWHPLGIPRVWDVPQWVEGNAWETEDGASKLTICARDSYWDHPMCWLDEDRVCVSGIGEDASKMIDGVRVFSLADPTDWETADGISGRGGAEVATFRGPVRHLFGDDSRLFVTGDSGLVIWDVTKQSEIAEIDGFFPALQHRQGRELAEVRGAVLRRWQY